MKRIRKDDVAGAYAEATDSTRHLLRVQTDDRQEHRIKPDLETHPEAAFDYDKGQLVGEQIPEPIPLRAHTCA